MSCDGQIMFDDDGRAWPRVGYYEVPTLQLSRNRDIIGMESVEAQNGESETQGVIVRYMNKDANYSAQPSAAWLNPFYYVPGQVSKFLQVDILTCQNHNQAMRLAKAIGMRSQPEHKILPTVGLRGLKARQERIIELQYDNTFSGDYEIVTPVEVDAIGIACGFGAVPTDANTWSLLPGEEKPAPVIDAVDTAYIIEVPEGVSVAYANGRLEATFSDPRRSDWRVRFQYSPAGESNWSEFAVQMENNFAYTGGIAANSDWEVRYQTVTSSGRVSAWNSPPLVINTSPLTLSGAPDTTGNVGVAYDFDITVTGGIGPYTGELVYGLLPPGVDIATFGSNQVKVSGTPTTDGMFAAISIKISDAIGNFRMYPAFTVIISP